MSEIFIGPLEKRLPNDVTKTKVSCLKAGGLQPKKNRTLPQISNLGLVFFFRFFHFGQF